MARRQTARERYLAGLEKINAAEDKRILHMTDDYALIARFKDNRIVELSTLELLGGASIMPSMIRLTTEGRLALLDSLK